MQLPRDNGLAAEAGQQVINEVPPRGVTSHLKNKLAMV